MKRLRLYDCRLSRLPTVIGACVSDSQKIADYVNTAQRRLLFAREAGDESWWGTWAEIVFNVSRDKPYFTFGREIARLEAILACDRPIPLYNQFYEYMQFGNGRLPKQFQTCGRPLITQGFTRNQAVTFKDMTPAPQRLRVYITEAADVGRRILFQGQDNTDTTIYSQDGVNRVLGEFVNFDTPFADAPGLFNRITGIQKDITFGQVQIFQVDPTTGVEVLLLTMEPSEQTAWYRRYYFDELPCGCCPPTPVPGTTNCPTVQVSAIVKLELLPVMVDTDYCLIQNLEAIIEEASSVRYSEVDNPQSKQMAAERHTQAVRLLNGELSHYLGLQTPSVNVAPFGTAHLSRQRIGSMM